ncbi:hypothetical protein NBH08_29875 [Faecalicatena sp. BF-R-105]|nr:hypothetical protein [Faecalicatena sp. BF-R-105]
MRSGRAAALPSAREHRSSGRLARQGREEREQKGAVVFRSGVPAHRVRLAQADGKEKDG